MKRELRLSHQDALSIPRDARHLLTYYQNQCDELGRWSGIFKCSMMPRSVNHQYKSFVRYIWVKNKKSGKPIRKAIVSKTMDDAIITFRKVFHLENRLCLKTLERNAITYGAIMVFYSPRWVTQQRSMAQRDLDNVIKATLDAFSHTTGIKDHRFTALHTYKAATNGFEGVKLWVFDLGDIVEYYKGIGGINNGRTESRSTSSRTTKG